MYFNILRCRNFVGLVRYSILIRTRPPQCSSWNWKQDCSDSPQKPPHEGHCCSCLRQSQGSALAPTKSPIKLSLFFALVIPGRAPDPPGRYAAGCSQERAAPMFQAELETRLCRFTAEAPTGRPLVQPPPTIA